MNLPWNREVQNVKGCNVQRPMDSFFGVRTIKRLAGTYENNIPVVIPPSMQWPENISSILFSCLLQSLKTNERSKISGPKFFKEIIFFFFTSSLRANCSFLSKQTKRAFVHIWLAHFLWFWRVMSFGPSCWYAANDFPSLCFSKPFLPLMELLWLEPSIFHGSPLLSADTQDSSGRNKESLQRHLNAWRTIISCRLSSSNCHSEVCLLPFALAASWFILCNNSEALSSGGVLN